MRGSCESAQDAGNFILPAYPSLIVKDSYWRWPERNLAGNTIDFHVQVLGHPPTGKSSSPFKKTGLLPG